MRLFKWTIFILLFASNLFNTFIRFERPSLNNISCTLTEYIISIFRNYNEFCIYFNYFNTFSSLNVPFLDISIRTEKLFAVIWECNWINTLARKNSNNFFYIQIPNYYIFASYTKNKCLFHLLHNIFECSYCERVCFVWDLGDLPFWFWFWLIFVQFISCHIFYYKLSQ